MYEVGETILCPMHGAGVIESVEKRISGNKSTEGFIIRIISSHLKVFIPIDSAKVSIRHLVPKETAEQLVLSFSNLESIENANWNKRYRENMDKVLSGDIYEVAKVYKVLLERSNIKSLSAGERKMLQSARQILLSELNVVLDKDIKIIEEEFKKEIS